MSKTEYEELIDQTVADLTTLKTYLATLPASDAAKLSVVKGNLLKLGGYEPQQEDKPYIKQNCYLFS